jgi:hypothetical protein
MRTNARGSTGRYPVKGPTLAVVSHSNVDLEIKNEEAVFEPRGEG